MEKTALSDHKTQFNRIQAKFHPDRKLRPVMQSLIRLLVRSRRLYEQGVNENLLRQYVQRWFTWLHSGLRNKVSNNGGFNRIWLFVLQHLPI